MNLKSFSPETFVTDLSNGIVFTVYKNKSLFFQSPVYKNEKKIPL